MNYHDTLILHEFSVFIFLSSSLLYLFNEKIKSFKILTFLGSFLTLITGMMLMRRFNLMGVSSFPLWVWLKLSLWLFITLAVPLLVKFCPKVSKKLHFPFLILVLITMAVAIYKPL